MYTLTRLILVLSWVLWISSAVGQPTARPEIGSRAALAELGRRQRLEMAWSSPRFPVETRHGKIEGRAADPAEVEAFLSVFVPEWGLYPPETVRKSGLRRVLFCRDLSFGGQL